MSRYDDSPEIARWKADLKKALRMSELAEEGIPVWTEFPEYNPDGIEYLQAKGISASAAFPIRNRDYAMGCRCGECKHEYQNVNLVPPHVNVPVGAVTYDNLIASSLSADFIDINHHRPLGNLKVEKRLTRAQEKKLREAFKSKAKVELMKQKRRQSNGIEYIRAYGHGASG